jgi:hypothetical protein
LRALSLCTCCRHYPGAAAGRRRRSSHQAVTAFPDNVVGSACTSSFSRPARRSLALRPAHSRRHLYVTCYTEGFSHFVTSMTAPVASGWSGWPGGACTHWKAPPCHGAHVERTLPAMAVDVAIGRNPAFGDRDANGKNAQIAVIHGPRGERVKSTLSGPSRSVLGTAGVYQIADVGGTRHCANGVVWNAERGRAQEKFATLHAARYDACQGRPTHG